MHGRSNLFVALEGVPYLAGILTAIVLILRYSEPVYALPLLLLFVLLFLLFRDPRRRGKSVALGVVSPVDGVISAIDTLASGELGEPVYRVQIRIDSLGTYTARCPIEGQIMQSKGRSLRVQTDEGDDMVLKFAGFRLGLPPRAFVRVGNRLGQGQRCAYVRLARTAEVQFSDSSKLTVAVGDAVCANVDILGTLPPPR